MADLTDEQCDAFRRPPGSFNDMVRAIYRAGRESTATPPADAALAELALYLDRMADRVRTDVMDCARLRQAAAALRARAVPSMPDGWSLAVHPDGGIVVQHRTLGGCFVTEAENQPREIPGQILFYLASDMLAASKAAEGKV